jgi:phosphotriesterase-related protein
MIVTVRGPIEDSLLGKTLVHEHILTDFSGAENTLETKYNEEDVIETMSFYLKAIKNLGFTGFIDCTPAYLGRNVKILLQLSRILDIHILTNTGYYGAGNDRYIPRFAYEEDKNKLASRWIKEWKEGIDGTNIKPGFIKIGVDPNYLSEIDSKLVEASAITHLETGLKIACHTGEGNVAIMVLEIIKRYKVFPSNLIVVHSDSIEDRDIIFRLADEGCWIEYDSIGIKPLDFHIKLIKETITRGFTSQLLLSHDAGWYNVDKPDGDKSKIRPYTYIPEVLIPSLIKEGIDDKIIDRILIENPASAFSIS